MKIGVKLRPSKTKGEHDPGHMGVYWRAEDGLEFRGFRFMIDDLPEDKQDASSWRDYLFENKVPGYVFDDIILQDDFHNRRDSLLAQNWTIRDDLESSVLQESSCPILNWKLGQAQSGGSDISREWIQKPRQARVTATG
jgi:hypothetical protein